MANKQAVVVRSIWSVDTLYAHYTWMPILVSIFNRKKSKIIIVQILIFLYSHFLLTSMTAQFFSHKFTPTWVQCLGQLILFYILILALKSEITVLIPAMCKVGYNEIVFKCYGFKRHAYQLLDSFELISRTMIIHGGLETWYLASGVVVSCFKFKTPM